MKKILQTLLLASMCLFALGFTAASAAPQNTKALVVVSFGTTFDEARTKDIGGIEEALQAAFPNRDFYRAFTSYIVMERLEKNKGITVHDLPTVLAQLKKDGYKDILIQSTHLLHGEEFEQKILPTVKKYQKKFDRVVIGNPLMTDEKDFAIAAAAIATQFPVLQKGEGIVLMGHGSPRDNNKSFGRTYNIMQKCFDDMGLPVVVGVVEEEDSPNVHAAVALVKNRNYQKVHMFPLMLVAGDHAHNDMYSDEEDSWKTKIEALGVETVGHLGGIGRNIAIQNIFVQHAIAAEAIGTTY